MSRKGYDSDGLPKSVTIENHRGDVLSKDRHGNQLWVNQGSYNQKPNDPQFDSHLAECYELFDIANDCNGTMTTMGHCSSSGGACCQCTNTGWGYFSFTGYAWDDYAPGGGTSFWDFQTEDQESPWMNQNDADFGQGGWLSDLLSNIGSNSSAWNDIHWNNQCACWFTCNDFMTNCQGIGGRGSTYNPSMGGRGW